MEGQKSIVKLKTKHHLPAYDCTHALTYLIPRIIPLPIGMHL